MDPLKPNHSVLSQEDMLNQKIKDSLTLLHEGTINEMLNYGNADAYFALYDKIALPVMQAENIRPASVYALYYSLALVIYSFIEEDNIHELLDNVELFRHIETHTAKESLVFLREISQSLFQLNDNRQKQNSDMVLRLKTHIDKNLNNDLSLTTLAKQGFFNPSYLSRIFKQETGYNLTEYILHRRLNKAKKELVDTDKKIQIISVDAGFKSPQYFNRVFKDNIGLTPQIYRRVHTDR